jgi:hypothetical protein
MGGAVVAGAAAARAQRRVMSYFMSRNAVSAEQAVAYTPDRRIEARFFERMRNRGVVKPGRNGGYYLDIPAYDAWRNDKRNRLKIVLLALVVALMAATLAAIFSTHHGG